MSKERDLTEIELQKRSLTCLSKGKKWQTKDRFLLYWIKLEEDKQSKNPLSESPKRECQMLEDSVEKVEEEEEAEVAPCINWNG